MKVIVVRGPNAGSEFRIERFPAIVGRLKETADIVLDGDEGISRRHCRIGRDDAGLWLEDLGSRNGTRVTNRRVRERTPLTAGDEITVGNSCIRLEEALDDAGEPLATVDIPDEAGSTTNSMLRAVEPSRATLVDLLPADPTTPREAAAATSGENTAIMRLDPIMLEKLRAQLHALRMVSEAIAQKPDLKDVFDVVVDATLNASMANRVAVLVRGDDGEMIPVVLRARAGHQPNLTVSRTVVQRAVQDRMTVTIRDTDTDEQLRTSDSVVAASARSALCVPVMFEGNVRAAVYLDATTPMAFLDDEVELVTAIANQAALALAHSSVREQLQSVCEHLQSAKSRNENMMQVFRDWSRTG